MDTQNVMFLMVIYIAIYYWSARNVLFWIKEFDKEYSSELGSIGRVGMANSLGILKILFDNRLPKQDYPQKIKFRLKIARRMLYLAPFLLIIVLLVVSFAKILGVS